MARDWRDMCRRTDVDEADTAKKCPDCGGTAFHMTRPRRYTVHLDNNTCARHTGAGTDWRCVPCGRIVDPADDEALNEALNAVYEGAPS